MAGSGKEHQELDEEAIDFEGVTDKTETVLTRRNNSVFRYLQTYSDRTEIHKKAVLSTYVKLYGNYLIYFCFDFRKKNI